MGLKKVTFWNCAGGIKSKFDYVVSHVNQNNPCIIFISESEVKENDLEILKIRGYDVVTSESLKSGLILAIKSFQ